MAATVYLPLVVSDTLLFPALHKDLVEGKYAVLGWAVAPSTFWFPDGLLYLISAVLTTNWAAAIALCCVLMWLSTLGSAIWLGREIWDEWRRPALLVLSVGALISLAATTMTWRPQHSMIFWHIAYPGLHGATLSVGLATAAASVRLLRGAGSTFPLLVVGTISGAMYISDRLYVTQFLVPILGTALLMAALRRVPFRPVMLLCIVSVLGLAIGFVVDYIVLAPLFVHPTPPTRKLDAAGQFQLFLLLLKQLWQFGVANVPLLAWPAVALVFAAGEFVLIRSLRRADFRLQFFSVFLILLTCCTLAAPAIAGLWYGIPTVRYVMPMFVLPALYLVLGIVMRLRIQATAFASVAVAICVMAILGSGERLPAVDLPYSEEVRCVDEAAQQYGLHAGISGYWPAKRISLQSRRGVVVNQLDPALQPALILTNPWWYRGPRTNTGYAYPHYDFALVVDELDPRTVLDSFGEPAARKQCGTYAVWVYNRPGDAYLRNFLRAKSIEITQGSRTLSEFEPVERKSVDGNQVLAKFSKSRRVTVAEFDKAAPADMDLAVMRGGQTVATVAVPRGSRYVEIPGNGMEADGLRLIPRSPEVQFDPGIRLY